MKKYLIAGFSLLAVLFLSLYFRSYPVFFPQLWQAAEKNVSHKNAGEIFSDLNKRYPDLDDISKSRLFETALSGYKKENRQSIKKQVFDEYARLKDRFQDKNGQTYLMELDGWNWARYVENIGRLGRIGDEVRNGKQHDSLMVFPKGEDLTCNNFFYYCSWGLYKVFSFFNPVGLRDFLFYLPLFFMAVFIVLLYIFCYRNLGNIAALICCLSVSTAPLFLPRSCAGWFDLDILTMIFPLLIIWTYLLAYNSPFPQKSAGWAIFAGFWLGLFCATWPGWPFIFFIIIFYELIVLANFISEHFQYGQDTFAQIKKHLVIPAVFILSGTFWIVMFAGLGPFEFLVTQVKEAVHLNNSLTSLVWPNVYSTVGELKTGDYLSVAKAVGGVVFLAFVLMSMLGIFLNIKKYQGMKRELLLVMVVWFMTMFFFCSKGIRFSIYLLIPLGIFLGWGIEEIRGFILRKNWKLVLVPFYLFVIWLAGSFVNNADIAAKNALPMMDDNWYGVLNDIKKYTPADSVINSWWDYGDWFKAVAGRRVIFDGQSQNSPRAYWMARVLLTDSEQEAVGILRMLNNGGNSAFETADKYLSNPFMSVSLIKRAIMLSPPEGKVLLGRFLPASAVKDICDILYSRPGQDAYFIVDGSMIGKMFPISYLGNWDFNKAYLSTVIGAKPREQVMRDLEYFGLGKDAAEKYYREASVMNKGSFDDWVSSRWAISGIAYQKRSDDGLVLFNNGYIYNPDRKTVYFYVNNYEGYMAPRSLFLEDNGAISEEIFPRSAAKYSAMVLLENDMYKLILTSPELARSVFIHLQFLNGKGLKHFIPFIREGQEDNRILVYKIKWD